MIWAKVNDASPRVSDEQIMRLLLNRLAQNKQLFWQRFLFELIVVVLLYSTFGVAVWWWGNQIQSFQFKIVGAVTLVSVPLIGSFFRSLRHLNQFEMATDLVAHLTETIRRIRGSVRWYQRMTYVSCGLIFLLCLTDASFWASPLWVKLYTSSVTLLVLLLTSVYLRRMYGRRIDQLESVLHQFQNLS